MKTSGERFTLGGRTFVPVGVTTIAHDHYFWRVARAAGLTEIEIRNGESADEFARRLLASLIDGGSALLMLACVIVPEDRGGRWSVETAEETAAFLGGLTASEDKAMVTSIIVNVLVGFFGRGLISLWSSRTSSETETGETRPQEETQAIEAAIDMGTGPTSFGP